MLQTNTTTYSSRSPRTPVLAESSRLLVADDGPAALRDRQSELAIDDALAGSFPASDPPAWNPGLARPIPAGASRDRTIDPGARAAPAKAVWSDPDVIDVSRHDGPDRTLRQALGSLAGAAGLALLAPFAILVVGLPIALAGRGALELVAWVFSVLS